LAGSWATPSNFLAHLGQNGKFSGRDPASRENPAGKWPERACCHRRLRLRLRLKRRRRAKDRRTKDRHKRTRF
jgi:hypothetical protein